MNGTFGTATGWTIIKTDSGAVAIVGFNEGEVEAFLNTLGKVAAGGGHVRMEREGFIVEYDETTDRFVFGGSPRVPFGGSPRAPFGGIVVPVFKFRRRASNETYAFYQTAEALNLAFSANDGSDGYPVRWRFNNDGSMMLPLLTAAPASPAAGMVVRADGAGWDPGAGAGLYEYRGGWQKL